MNAEDSLISALSASHYSWESTGDMIKRILYLFEESTWVRNYLLDEGHHREQDANILASMQPKNHSHIRACLCDESEFTQVFLPAYADGEVGAGVLAQYSDNTAISVPCRTARFVSDIKSGSTLIVYNKSDDNRLDIFFIMPGPTQGFIAYFTFGRAAFLGGTVDDQINYDIIHLSLLHSYSGVFQRTNRSSGTSDSYPWSRPEIFGHRSRYQVNTCAYADGIPLMAFSRHMICSKRRIDSSSFYHCEFDLERLKRMGIRSLLQQSSPGTPVAIAPTPTNKPAAEFEIEQTDHDISSAARKERRQIQKREAAARSYARKREKRIAAQHDVASPGNSRDPARQSEHRPGLDDWMIYSRRSSN